MSCIFAPLEYYISDRDEFWFDIYEGAPPVLAMFAAALVLGALVNSLLCVLLRGIGKETVYHWILALETGVIVCFFLQGNFMAGHLPVLDGHEIDWGGPEYRFEQIKSVLLWVLVSGAVVFCGIKFKIANVIKSIGFICAGLFFIMILSLSVGIIGGDSGAVFEKRVEKYRVSDTDLFRFSTDQNLIVLLLDYVDSADVAKMLEEEPEDREIFRDFTYFPDTQGLYPYTHYAIPQILSGKCYENSGSFNDYYIDAMDNSPLLKSLEGRGFAMGLYEPESRYITEEANARLDNLYQRDIHLVRRKRYDLFWLELVGFRYLPYPLKPLCKVTDLEEFEEMKSEPPEGEPEDFSWNNYDFFRRLWDWDIDKTDQKCFRFIHLKGWHKTHDTDLDGYFTLDPVSDDDALRVCFKLAREFLDKLRSAGVYDNSAILIMADHGDNREGFGQNPAFFVKGINESHEMKTSEARLSYADLQEIFEDLLDGADSGKLEQYGKTGEGRRFLWYEYKSKAPMVEYMQTGGVNDGETFVPTGRVFDAK
ncbi:MAG: hypothetical protein K5985_11560 [Lachnospiraceae bacterium]|nr:hypothetical protein [Lachnospiraceae bacterium]